MAEPRESDAPRALVGVEEREATTPAHELLSRVRWEPAQLDPRRMSAYAFMEALLDD